MSSSGKKDRSSSSYKKTHSSSSPKSHHHKASDSGVGSLSDQDSLAANPDGNFTAQGYQQQSQSSHALREALDAARFDLDLWKQKYRELEEDLRVARSDHRDLDASFRALSLKNSLLEADQKTHATSIRKLQDALRDKADEADRLREDLRRFRHSPPQEPNVSAPLGPGPSFSSRVLSDHKLPRTESSRKEKTREGEGATRRRQGASSKPLRQQGRKGPFELPLCKLGLLWTLRALGALGTLGPLSSHQLHRAFGPGHRSVANEPALQNPRSGRDYVPYGASSGSQPMGSTSTSTPRSVQVPSYAAGYSDSVFYDESEFETGDYYAHPLPEKKNKSRR
ncbi:predicted protein [Verticillium alfalfae VaMs.102]|uniref:Predicted protein n=1 Tax=Verticillium alfalfae (strain VaMs.102 / ATCC MYA-4576 / FGSC 10136) TaxID=526221 RepID=C9SAI1_VERA1|nr:predicted protein [Verticillium alfalfae VaMs.102]EEY15429.1 predicted protein [Verticillium alfalfae VaMs.102]